MKSFVALIVFVASAALTTIGAVILLLLCGLGVAAFVMALKLRRAINDLEVAVGAQAEKLAQIAGHVAGG